jgi:hypothetical protein
MKVAPSLTLLVLAIACGGEKTPPPDTTPAAEPVSQTPNAAVTIISPAEGDTTGPDVTIVLGTTGVTIEKASGVRADGIGHHHLFLDTAAVAEGQVIPAASAHVVHIGTGDSTYTFKGLTPGAHDVVAVIGFGDHSAMAARRDTVRFIVRR